MNHPYRDAPSLESAVREWRGPPARRSCCHCGSTGDGAASHLPQLWIVALLGALIVQAIWVATAVAVVSLTDRTVAAVERLDGVARAAIASADAASRAAASQSPTPASSPPAAIVPAPPPEPAFPLTLGFLKVTPTTFLLERRVLDAFLEERADNMHCTRILPESEQGSVVGIRIFGVHPDTWLGRLGFENGDRLETINGLSVSTPEKALEAYGRLRSANHFTVVVSRRGSAMTLDYFIV
jgi:hypothetical protein